MSSSSGLTDSAAEEARVNWSSFWSNSRASPLKASSLRREELGVATAEGTKVVGVGLRPGPVEWRWWARRTLLK